MAKKDVELFFEEVNKNETLKKTRKSRSRND